MLLFAGTSGCGLHLLARSSLTVSAAERRRKTTEADGDWGSSKATVPASSFRAVALVGAPRCAIFKLSERSGPREIHSRLGLTLRFFTIDTVAQDGNFCRCVRENTAVRVQLPVACPTDRPATALSAAPHDVACSCAAPCSVTPSQCTIRACEHI